MNHEDFAHKASDLEQAVEFLRFLQQFDERQQLGICLAIEGLQLMEKKKTAPARSG